MRGCNAVINTVDNFISGVIFAIVPKDTQLQVNDNDTLVGVFFAGDGMFCGVCGTPTPSILADVVSLVFIVGIIWVSLDAVHLPKSSEPSQLSEDSCLA